MVLLQKHNEQWKSTIFFCIKCYDKIRKSELRMKKLDRKEGNGDGYDELQRHCATECNDL